MSRRRGYVVTAHSLKRDVRSHELTNVADVTPDQPPNRASIAPLRFRSSAAQRPPPYQKHPAGFFGTPAAAAVAMLRSGRSLLALLAGLTNWVTDRRAGSARLFRDSAHACRSLSCLPLLPSSSWIV